ncbi:MAG TPA: hypothetical protein VIJ62_14240 [Rhizomicrobium sp.]
MRDLFITTGFVLLGILTYGFRAPILARLRRFDAENIARKEQEISDRADSLAHFRHTLKLAEEQVEAVNEIVESDPRTATPVARFVFEGEIYATRFEADKARQEKIRGLAREFYVELPRALASRGNGKLGKE